MDLAFEFVNKGRGLAEPFEPLLGGEPMKLGVAVEVFRCALRERALKFFGC